MSHARTCGLNPKELWKYLKIRFPKEAIYFSLTAQPDEERAFRGKDGNVVDKTLTHDQ